MIQFELETDRSLFQGAMQFAQMQIRNLVDKNPDLYPMYTESGRWKHSQSAWAQWCDGFLPGLMWIFHRHIGAGAPEADWWMDVAVRYSKPLDERFKAQLKLSAMPRNGAKIRIRNRCEVTGRSRSVYRKLMMSRIALRELGNQGAIPGLVKSSW